MNAERPETKTLPVIPEVVITSSLGVTMKIWYNEMFPFGMVGDNHVTLIDDALIATKLSGFTAAGAVSKQCICIVNSCI